MLLWVLMAFSLSLASCSNDHEPDNPKPPVDDKRQTIEFPVALLSSLPDGYYGTAIEKAIPLRAPIGDASVAIISGLDLRNADKAELNGFLERGGIVVVVNPDNHTDDVLSDDLNDNAHPYNDETDALAFAFDGNNRYIIVQSQPLVVEQTDEIEILSDEEFNSLMGKKDEGETDEDDATYIDGEQDQPELKEDDRYYYNRIEFLIEWINERCQENSIESRSNSTRADKAESHKVDLKDFSAKTVSYEYHVDLKNQLEKAASSKPDSLKGKGEIILELKEYPLYVFDIPPYQSEAAGEYYIIEAKLKARNESLWNPQTFTHGGCASRLVGYFMKSVNLEVALVNGLKSDRELEEISFYDGPQPGTTIGSTTYSKSCSFEISGTVTGKASIKPGEGVGIGVGVSAGFKAGWSRTKAQTFPDIVTRKIDREKAIVGYEFNVKNIDNQKKMKDLEDRYPAICRSSYDQEMWWIWKVPHGSNGIANDKEHSPFYYKVTLGAEYGAYSWWRGGSKGTEHKFTVKSKPQWLPLEAPSHASFGIIALHNQGKYPIANIKIFNEKGSVKVPDSYANDKYARQAVKTGIYSVAYDFVDAANGNRIVERWQIDNVEVNISNDMESATTTISTADAGAHLRIEK